MERNYNLDKMKFYCIIAIVCIHTIPFKGTVLGWIINTLCRSAVPLFFICSGYLFYSKCNYDYAKKYFLKIFSLYFRWGIFYIIFDLFITYILNLGNNISFSMLIKEFFNDFDVLCLYYTNNVIELHLWYLSSTLVLIPILYIVIKKNLLSKVLFISFILNILGVFLFNMEFRYILTTRDAIFLGLFYMVLGAYIKSKEEALKVKIRILSKNYILIIIIFILFSILEKGIYSIYFNRVSDYFISTIPLSFLIFIKFLEKDNRKNITSRIGENSVGIYLIHVAIINIIKSILLTLDLYYIVEFTIFQILYTPIVIIISYIVYNFIQLNYSKLKKKYKR